MSEIGGNLESVGLEVWFNPLDLQRKMRIWVINPKLMFIPSLCTALNFGK